MPDIGLFKIIFNWSRQTAQPHTRYYTTHNRLSRRTATSTRFSPKGIGCQKHRRRQGVANIRSGGLLPRKHSPDGAISICPIKQARYSFIDPRKDERLSWPSILQSADNHPCVWQRSNTYWPVIGFQQQVRDEPNSVNQGHLGCVARRYDSAI